MDFQQLQRDFAAHLRNPDTHPAPAGVEDRRMAIYRELFFNNVNGFLQQGFPVLHSLLPPQRWQKLVRDFFHLHASETPYFVEVPEQFVAFLASGRARQAGDPPFMLELAHYEWMELVLDVSTEVIVHEGIDPQGDLLAGIPVASPLQVLLSYAYPVHKVCADFQPAEPLPTPVWLGVYRNREDQVGFMEVNQVTARLLQLINDNQTDTGRELIARLGAEMHFPDPAKLEHFASDTLQHLRANDILIGTLIL
ncbi:hypothetical protein A11A3_15881 [Alcanivorax hongdengensis A-11-3]|uniref:Uncharacterized protein n=1 Tax=Alcanivorax hongdengensis A-11-3 TaxID=1177179 RepID=L0WBA7_9GAMM|nr:putative DNA-binding domain-containing protein [Alcanivorax hongdengensis]EKF73000.1 hypothetical protein A11A3_15881 [Alcanivorax hongdengensis A-11-3]